MRKVGVVEKAQKCLSIDFLFERGRVRNKGTAIMEDKTYTIHYIFHYYSILEHNILHFWGKCLKLSLHSFYLTSKVKARLPEATLVHMDMTFTCQTSFLFPRAMIWFENVEMTDNFRYSQDSFHCQKMGHIHFNLFGAKDLNTGI